LCLNKFLLPFVYIGFFGSVEYIGLFEEIYENFDEDERKDGRR
jgi:hypothetical protein